MLQQQQQCNGRKLTAFPLGKNSDLKGTNSSNHRSFRPSWAVAHKLERRHDNGVLEPKHSGCPSPSGAHCVFGWLRTTPASGVLYRTGLFAFSLARIYSVLFYATVCTFYQRELVNWRSDSSKRSFSTWARTCQVSNIYSEHSGL